MFLSKFFNEGRYRNRFKSVKLEISFIAPIGKLPDSPEICSASVRISNIDCEEFDEPLRCVSPGVNDYRRNGVCFTMVYKSSLAVTDNFVGRACRPPCPYRYT